MKKLLQLKKFPVFDKYKDPRVNAKSLRPLLWLLLFALYNILFWGFSALVDRVWSMDSPRGIIFAIIGAYVLVASGVSVLVGWLLYRVFILRHINSVKRAAQTVAGGDYSVRIPPHRKDGKKDEIQVLFDDFNTMAAALESNEMLKKDFISNISHELKTPLAAIQNFSAMLQSDGIPESDRKEFARNISEATRRLTVLVTDILQLSRLENQTIAVNRNIYNLSDQLSRCIIGFELVWEQKNIEIQTDFDEEINIVSDERLLEIVWNNLLSNAFKFTKEGGVVKVSLQKAKGGALIKVEDSGCGMTQEQISRIFEKFYQADLSHSTKGNGLGLALVKRIVDLLGATITVESQPQKGSVFSVFIRNN